MNRHCGLGIEKADMKSVDQFCFFFQSTYKYFPRIIEKSSCKCSFRNIVFLETLSYLQHFPRTTLRLFEFVCVHLNDLIHIPVIRFLTYIRA